ncbi:MAG TPA: hypothetical protein VJ608_04975 [Albitalea sp.]|nr:hypothetical protein [Albitalea sp.]
MTIFRWVIGVLTALLAGGTALTFVIFILNGEDEWMDLTRKLRRWVYLLTLFWFNFEIWRRIILTLIHW